MSEINQQKITEAVEYIRVSSKEQEKEGFSVPSQQKLLSTYAKQNGFHIVRQFIDVETAKKPGRSSFNEMVSFLKQNQNCRTVITEKTDRIYRNIKDWVTIDELDLELHFVKENVVLTKDSRSSEKFIHGIKVLMAKNYIDNLSEETRKGMTEKAEQGFWPTLAPYGYKNVLGPNGKRIIEADPDRAPHITRLYERYATGNYSLKDIAKMARKDGMCFSKTKSPVPRATVHRVLRNRIYTGDFDWNGKTYRGSHIPLVTQELWDQVQDVLDGRYVKKHRKAKHDFAFSRLVSCGHCGCSLVGEIKKKRYIYYHCTGYKGKCHEPYIREEVLEKQFTEVLKDLSFDEEVMSWISEALHESHIDEKDYHEKAIDDLHKEYTKLQSRIDTMYMDKLDGRIDNAFFDRMSENWHGEQNRILRDIEQHQKANQSYFNEGIKILELARKASSLFEKQQPHEKRKLLNFLLSNCSWKDRKLEVTYRQPFDIIAKSTADYKEKQAVGTSSDSLFDIWRPCRDSNSEPTA